MFALGKNGLSQSPFLITFHNLLLRRNLPLRKTNPLGKQIIISVDGYSACGKSTLAKDLAEELGYVFIDSGAMYRAVTYYFLEHGVDFYDDEAIAAALQNINIHFGIGAKTQTYLNGDLVETAIREMRISQQVSQVATIKAVRKFLVAQQQQLGVNRGVVMDGRDIGTVVFPQAELKIFLTADINTRLKRRILQLQQQGKASDQQTVIKNLYFRDYIDRTRSVSPLKMAADAIKVDNTNLSPKEQVELVKTLVALRTSS